MSQIKYTDKFIEDQMLFQTALNCIMTVQLISDQYVSKGKSKMKLNIYQEQDV